MQRGWELLEGDLELMAAAARQGGFGLLVVHIPEHSDVINGHRAVADRLHSRVAAMDLPSIDTHALLAPSRGEGYYFPVDGHLNARGYDLGAQAIAAAMGEADGGR